MIRINKNYIVYHSHSMDEKSRFIDVDQLPMYLTEEVLLDKTVTFESIFNLLIKHGKLFNHIFFSTMGGHTIDMFIDDFMKNDDDKDSESIDYLELYWHSEYWNFDDSEKELSCYPSFHGVCENYTDDNFKDQGKMNISILGSNLNSLKKCKVKINPKIQYHDFIIDKKNVKERFPLIIEGNRNFRFVDLIQAILVEISFFGTPKERDEKMKELNDTSHRIQRGEEKLYKMEFEDGKINLYNEDGSFYKTMFDDDDSNCDCLNNSDQDSNCDCGENCKCKNKKKGK